MERKPHELDDHQYRLQITAIHAALLPTEPEGVVLYYGDWDPLGGGIGVQEITHGRLYRMVAGLSDPIEVVPTASRQRRIVFAADNRFWETGVCSPAAAPSDGPTPTKDRTCPTMMENVIVGFISLAPTVGRRRTT